MVNVIQLNELREKLEKVKQHTINKKGFKPNLALIQIRLNLTEIQLNHFNKNLHIQAHIRNKLVADYFSEYIWILHNDKKWEVDIPILLTGNIEYLTQKVIGEKLGSLKYSDS